MSHEGQETTISFDGEHLAARHGEALLMCLLRNAKWDLQHGDDGHARGPFCNMGTCFDCVVVLDDGVQARSCLTPITPRMTVTSRDER